jgi:hypothetical protein
MTAGEARALLGRALHLSLEVLAVAEGGDIQALGALDAERLRLLSLLRTISTPIDADARLLLQQIKDLNDKAIGFLEHRRRIKSREIDTAKLGRRALIAYSATRLQL